MAHRGDVYPYVPIASELWVWLQHRYRYPCAGGPAAVRVEIIDDDGVDDLLTTVERGPGRLTWAGSKSSLV